MAVVVLGGLVAGCERRKEPTGDLPRDRWTETIHARCPSGAEHVRLVRSPDGEHLAAGFEIGEAVWELFVDGRTQGRRGGSLEFEPVGPLGFDDAGRVIATERTWIVLWGNRKLVYDDFSTVWITGKGPLFRRDSTLIWGDRILPLQGRVSPDLVVVSPDRSAIAYVVVTGFDEPNPSETLMVDGNVFAGPVPEIGRIALGPGGKPVVHTAGGVVHVDGKPLPGVWTSVHDVVIGPRGRVAVVGDRAEGDDVVMVDGKQHGPAGCRKVIFSPDGGKVALACAAPGSATGTLVRDGEREVIEPDGAERMTYDASGTLAYRSGTSIVSGTRRYGPYEDVEAFAQAPVGSHVAYVATMQPRVGQLRDYQIFVDGIGGPPFPCDIDHCRVDLFFSPDGAHVIGLVDGVVTVGGHPIGRPGWTFVGPPRFSADGRTASIDGWGGEDRRCELGTMDVTLY